jgi:flavin-dependent dehydrogenase
MQVVLRTLEAIFTHPNVMQEDVVQIMGAGLSGLSASILLAKAGKEVHVHDIRADSGARFDGDFQGLENWSSDTDFLDEMREWGINPDEFKATPFKEVDIIHPDDVITQAYGPKVAFRVVERGTAEHTIDQGLKRQALAAGVNIHYKSRVKSEDCTIIASGPKGTSAIAYGEVFKTSFPDHVSLHLNDKLAPGAYAYLIVIDGIGLICTCLWRKQSKSERFLNETVAWYQQHYPDLDMQPIKRVGGKGDFTINDNYKVDGRYYVGEAGGMQDFMWGFGMRYAITSGVLAAQDILGGQDYDKQVRKILLPLIKTSVANRFLMNRIGDKGMKRVCSKWMKDQKKKKDGLKFIERIFRGSIWRNMVYSTFGKAMLSREVSKDGRKFRKLPFRKDLKHDRWQQSEAAIAVGKRWDEVRKSGGKASFTEDNPTS